MKFAKVASVLQKNGVTIGDQITVRGWVRGIRKAQKTETFIDVSDGSSLKHLQVLVKEDPSKITFGCSVEVEGELVKAPSVKQDVELSAKKITVVGTTDPLVYPLQAKGHPSMEFLREINHLRPRTNFFGGVLRLRNASLMNFHNFLQKEGFICVHTPIITNNDCEGGGQAFQVSRSKSEDKEFFGSSAFLTVSGQLEAEMMACAMSKVYTFGPTFRAEDSHTARHLAEFTMLEPEFVWANLNDCMNLSENMIKYAIQNILNSNADEIQFFNDRIDKNLINRLKQTVDKKFDVVTYTEAVELLQKNKVKKGSSCNYEDIQFGMDLGREHEKYLTEELFNNPVFVINWPKSIKPFYMRQNEDGITVAAMDLLVPEVGEIVGGSAREERPDLLEDAMKKANLIGGESEANNKYQWYLQLRQFGSVPHGGFGLGYERFIQYITGIKNIRDVIPCPRYGNSFSKFK